MLNHKELDRIWNQALNEANCECKNDNKWEEDVTGYIYCAGCKQWIVKPKDFEERMKRKAVVTDYVFVEGQGLSGVLFPDGTFVKCGNTEHHLLMSDIPLEVQTGCLYFSSKLNGDRHGIITHSPFNFPGITAAQIHWIEEHVRYYDEGQKWFDYTSWKRKIENQPV